MELMTWNYGLSLEDRVNSALSKSKSLQECLTMSYKPLLLHVSLCQEMTQASAYLRQKAGTL